MDKVFEILNVDKLPRDSRGRISWKSVEKGFVFKTNHRDYGYNEFEFESYDIKKQEFIIRYSRIKKTIHKNNFLSGKIGEAIGFITKDFKIEVGQIFKDEKRNLIIIDREYRENPYNKGKKLKYYKYKCNKCTYNDWVMESSLLGDRTGCSCCNGKTVVLGINTIYDTDPWMMDLGVFEQDAKRYTKSSNKKIIVKCPDCKTEKEVFINNVYKRKSIGCSCGDGRSYPEKFVTSMLKQLGVEFQTQLSKTTFTWCDKYKYDFYIPSMNMIIETHGGQHYKSTNSTRTLQEEQENDRIKKELALSNGVKHYIIVDCRKSELEFIKSNILNSNLAFLSNLSTIDWLQCEEFALKNIIKEVCEYWNQKEDWETTNSLAKLFNSDKTTIIRYLKKGVKIGWTNYDPKEEMRKRNHRKSKLRENSVKMFKDGNLLAMFRSCSELEKQSEEKFGVKLFQSNISSVCRGKIKEYKGFTFQYI